MIEKVGLAVEFLRFIFQWFNRLVALSCHLQPDEAGSETSKKSPNVYKICPKMIWLENLKILAPLKKLPKNVGDLGKLIIAKGFEKLPKVQ